jgi:hypothetical protein
MLALRTKREFKSPTWPSVLHLHWALSTGRCDFLGTADSGHQNVFEIIYYFLTCCYEAAVEFRSPDFVTW